MYNIGTLFAWETSIKMQHAVNKIDANRFKSTGERQGNIYFDSHTTSCHRAKAAAMIMPMMIWSR